MTVVAREGNLKTERLTARKTHHCRTESRACTGPIGPGEVYLRHTAYPGHDALGLDCEAPQSMAECAACARLYGRQAEIGLRS